jgi:predicted Zn-dependent protease with MMP-like domain
LSSDAKRVPVRLSTDDFEGVLSEAIDALPDEFTRPLETTEILVEPVPLDWMDRSHRLSRHRPTSSASSSAPPSSRCRATPPVTLPRRIFLFQRNLERLRAIARDLVEEIRTTLFHEIGHMLGFDEEGVASMGLAVAATGPARPESDPGPFPDPGARIFRRTARPNPGVVSVFFAISGGMCRPRSDFDTVRIPRVLETLPMSKTPVNSLVAVAFAALIAGRPARELCQREEPIEDELAVSSAAHACKGMNACKGQGGCGSSNNGLPRQELVQGHGWLRDRRETTAARAMNACKGQGGCQTSDNGCQGARTRARPRAVAPCRSSTRSPELALRGG